MPNNDREKIIQKIQNALKIQPEKLPTQPNFTAEIYTDSPEMDLAVIFAQNFTAMQGKFCFCGDEQDFIDNLEKLLREKQTKEVFVWEKPLQEIFDVAQIPYKGNDTDFMAADIGITTCEALVARTGSLIVSSNTTSGRRLSIYPNIHVVVAFTSQLIYDLQTALEQIKLKYKYLPSMLSVTTGPSRTADIEKTLVLGAHGPKELYVFLIDDFVEQEEVIEVGS